MESVSHREGQRFCVQLGIDILPIGLILLYYIDIIISAFTACVSGEAEAMQK